MCGSRRILSIVCLLGISATRQILLRPEQRRDALAPDFPYISSLDAQQGLDAQPGFAVSKSSSNGMCAVIYDQAAPSATGFSRLHGWLASLEMQTLPPDKVVIIRTSCDDGRARHTPQTHLVAGRWRVQVHCAAHQVGMPKQQMLSSVAFKYIALIDAGAPLLRSTVLEEMHWILEANTGYGYVDSVARGQAHWQGRGGRQLRIPRVTMVRRAAYYSAVDPRACLGAISKCGHGWQFSYEGATSANFGAQSFRSRNSPSASRSRLSRLILIMPWMEMGGADRFNLQLTRMLTEDGWGVTVVATLGTRHPWRAKFEEITPEVFVLPAFLSEFKDRARFCAHLLRSRQPDVLMVTNSRFGYEVLPSLSSVAATLPRPVTVVDYNHMIEPRVMDGGYPGESVRLQHVLDVHVVASESVKEWMVDRGLHPDRIRTCYIGVNRSEYLLDRHVRDQTRARLGIPPSELVVLLPARLTGQKRPLLFVQIIARVSENVHFSVVVAGDGPFRQALAHKLERLKDYASHEGTTRLNRVIMLGTVDYDNMHQIMQAADVVMVPSKLEGIALVAYEAMALGKVFIGAAVGGQPELITPDCRCGMLVPTQLSQLEELDAYVERLTQVLVDVELRRQIGRAAIRQISRAFDSSGMYRCLLRAFDEGKKLGMT